MYNLWQNYFQPVCDTRWCNFVCSVQKRYWAPVFKIFLRFVVYRYKSIYSPPLGYWHFFFCEAIINRTHQEGSNIIPRNGTEYSEQKDELEQVQTEFISNSTTLFIPQDWLWISKAAEVSCTGFCSKATELHSPTVWTDSELGSFSHK